MADTRVMQLPQKDNTKKLKVPHLITQTLQPSSGHSQFTRGPELLSPAGSRLFQKTVA